MPDLHPTSTPPPARGLRIAGLGRYLPERVVANAELEARFDLPEGWIEAKNGVRERRRADVAGGECASFMGARAVEEALSAAGWEPGDLDLIVNASGTPEQAIPDGGPLLQRALGLERSGIASFSVHATCLSFLAALDVVASLVETGRHRRVAIVSSDIGSLGVQGNDAKSESLWGDAAAAAVVEAPGEGQDSALERSLFRTWSEGAELTQIRGGGTKLHPGREGAGVEELRFEMQGQAVLQMSLRRAARFFNELAPELRREGMCAGPSGLALAVTHQPSRVGLEALTRFGITAERTVTTLASLGNCVAASLPSTLYEAQVQGRLRRGERVLLFGTGAGLSMAGAVLRY